jgi:hypothetical protein
MSALPPKADIEWHSSNVRFVPKADSCSAAKQVLFDHLVGVQQERGRGREADFFSGLEIEDKFEFRGLLDSASQLA